MDPLEEIREQQKTSWNKFAPGWKKWDAKTMAFLGPVGDALLNAARLEAGDRVLDVAAGTGEPGLTAARRVREGSVVGTDLSEEMVRIAAENARARGLGNYSARVADASALPFADGTFDAALCRFGLMFFPDPAAGAREIGRALAPGGRLALSVWGPPERNLWASLIAKIVFETLGLPKPSHDAPGIFRFDRPGSAAAVLEAAGFKDVRETVVEGTVAFASSEEYWEMMTEIAAPIAGALAQADAPARGKVRAAVLESAAKHAGRDGLALPWQAYAVSGTR